MTALNLLLLASSILGWFMYATEHRRGVRALRRQSMVHIQQLAQKHCRSLQIGLALGRRHPEASKPTTQEAVDRLTI